MDGGLARRVGAHSFGRVNRRLGADVDDAPRSAFEKIGERRTGRVQRRLQVDGEHPVPAFRVDRAGDLLPAESAGDVEKRVDTPEPRRHLGHRPLRRMRQGKVDPDHEKRFGAEPLGKARRRGGRVVERGNGGAALDGRLRDGAPQRAERPCHHDRLAFHGHAANSIGVFTARNCCSALARALAASAALASFTLP